MAHPTPRIHRLPHRLDYTLIPAPLDLSLPLATEKSPLPAIIVTPSSPSSSHDFSIAFLAPPPKPSIIERLSSYAPFQPPVKIRARSTLIVFAVIFVLMCHIITHQIAARRPYLEFAVQDEDAHIAPASKWFNLHSLRHSDVPDEKGISVSLDTASHNTSRSINE